MIKTIAAVLTALMLSLPAMANEQKAKWVLVQDGEVYQLASSPTENPPTNIDFISVIGEEGVRIYYFLIRRQCENDNISKTVVGLGKRVGFGLGCNGNTVAEWGLPALLTKVEELPKEAKLLTCHNDAPAQQCLNEFRYFKK